MPRFSLRWGLVVLLCTGCHWSPYSPYYPGYYGPTYVPPGSYVAPGGTIVAPGSSPTLNSPTPITPGTTSPSPTPNWRPQNGTGSDAPPFQANPPNNPVPFPNDDFGTAPGAAATRPQSFQSTPTASVQPAGLVGNDPFSQPNRIPPNADALPSPTDARLTSQPYAYDGSAYSWLKGIVDYDEESQSWAIIYSLTPEASDRFGGMFYLGASEQLKTLQHGDLVLLYGQPDPLARDPRGLPVYRVTRVTQLGRPAQ